MTNEINGPDKLDKFAGLLLDFFIARDLYDHEETKVAMAYHYATVMIAHRNTIEQYMEVETPKCPKCQSTEIKKINLHDIQNPTRSQTQCLKCGHILE